jgi:hypothetical protein
LAFADIQNRFLLRLALMNRRDATKVLGIALSKLSNADDGQSLALKPGEKGFDYQSNGVGVQGEIPRTQPQFSK